MHMKSVRLNHEYLEILRVWRNDSENNRYFEIREFITADEQVKWFNELSESDYYWIFLEENVPIGYGHLNIINLDSASVGLMIGEKSYRSCGLGFSASKFLLHYAFDTLNLNSIVAKVHNENIESLAYNRYIGFENLKTDKGDFTYQILERKVFEANRQLYNRMS